MSDLPLPQGLPAQLIVQGQPGGKGLPATVTVQQLQQIVKSVAGGGQGQATQQVGWGQYGQCVTLYIGRCGTLGPVWTPSTGQCGSLGSVWTLSAGQCGTQVPVF